MRGAEINADDLTWKSAIEIRDLVAKGEVSAVDVLDHFLGRLEEFNPKLKVMTKIDAAGARKAAQAADAAVRAKAELGPLLGVPFAVKSQIRAEGLPFMQTPHINAFDAIPVERLKKAGGVLVGTNTMLGEGSAKFFEEINWESEARNPWDPRRTPGWSSSGGAAAVAAGLLPFTIGSDGGGSTRLPAAYSGVIGVHPTSGIMPDLDYEDPRGPSGLTMGPLTRSVRDAALVTQIMSGPDGRDPFAIPYAPPDMLTPLEDGAKGLRLAWTDDFGFASIYAKPETPRVLQLVRDAAMGLRSLGATVDVTKEVWEDTQPDRNAQFMAFRFKMPAADIAKAQTKRARNWQTTHKLFQEYDLLLTVTSLHVAFTTEAWSAAWGAETKSYPHQTFASAYTSNTDMFNWLMFPAINVPCGFVDGLPVGLQIAGPPGSEPKIFRLARAFEKAFPRNERPPVS